MSPTVNVISPETLKLDDAVRLIASLGGHGRITVEVRDGRVVLVEVTHKLKYA